MCCFVVGVALLPLVLMILFVVVGGVDVDGVVDVVVDDAVVDAAVALVMYCCW